MVEKINKDKEEIHPPWEHPLTKIQDHSKIFRTGLYLNNSLTGKKEEFITSTGTRKLTWYMCGPTVYDASHLGHARTYISFDIVRRVFSHYFGYDVKLCMNVTDIDDKIIIRSNQLGEEFHQFAKKWEADFFKDMGLLNVLYPDYITRVSEYVPEIQESIKSIINNGFAYSVNNSVYFDIESFKKKGFNYAKLSPSTANSKDKLLEGEGSLTAELSGEKRSAGDFALWKKSKENEPSWESEWGPGRPGWHIECSAMCSSIFGQTLDIHSGGVDLKFPHHDNEIAQSEGMYSSSQWVNYFIHTGHLNIGGQKMAKSLKNFTKICDILDKYSPNAIRLFYVIHNWNTDMDYSEEAMKESVAKEKQLLEFFQNLKIWFKENDLKRIVKFNEADFELSRLLDETKLNVHNALCDNINTPKAFNYIYELISKTYSYQNNNKAIKVHLLSSIGQFVAHILRSTGLNYKTDFLEFYVNEASAGSKEDVINPYIEVLSKFRSEIIAKAQAKDTGAIFNECDRLRDEVLPEFGIKLEDRSGLPTVWKFYEKEILLKELEAKKNEKKEKKEKKPTVNKYSSSAKDYFATLTDKYSKFDEEGLPTHSDKGKELSKEQLNKIRKDFNKHQEEHLKFLEKQNK